MGYDQVFSALQTGVIDGPRTIAELRFRQSLSGCEVLHADEHLSCRRFSSSRARLGTLVGRSGAAAQAGARGPADERVLWAAYEKQAMDKARASGPDRRDYRQAAFRTREPSGTNTPRFAEQIKRIAAVN